MSFAKRRKHPGLARSRFVEVHALEGAHPGVKNEVLALKYGVRNLESDCLDFNYKARNDIESLKSAFQALSDVLCEEIDHIRSTLVTSIQNIITEQQSQKNDILVLTEAVRELKSQADAREKYVEKANECIYSRLAAPMQK